jgi:hypothetical protein
MAKGDVTRLLAAAESGDRSAFDALYRSVYDELRRIAQANMRRESAGHTLQPTALVNEAYLRLAPASSNWTAAVISSVPPPRQCGAFSWITPGSGWRANGAPNSSASP